MKFKKTEWDELWDMPIDPAITFKNKTCEHFAEASDLHVCPTCNTERKSRDFLPGTNTAWNQVDAKGKPITIFCRYCIARLYEYFIKLDEDHNVYRALYRICSLNNIYYDDRLAHKVLDEPRTWEDKSPVSEKISPADLYIRAVFANDNISVKSFWESDNPGYYDVVKAQNNVGEWNDQDKSNRRVIIAMYHYDPFETESFEDRKRLMSSLVTMIDDSMADDLVRQNAAVDIVRQSLRAEKISNALIELTKTPEDTIANDKQIKNLMTTKKQANDMISAFCKDNGFSERYATSKSKGSGTLSAITREIQDKGYDQGAINAFDIKTSAAMQQVSDISASSIFKQLALTDNDYAKMVQEQAEVIQKLNKKLEESQEALRLLKTKQLKQELLEEYRKDLELKGINEKEIKEFCKEQLKTPTEFRP